MFKAFISQGATINIVDGEPGAGKTLTLSQAQLASTENMIDLYEKAIVEFEIKYPNFNFAKVRLLFKIFFMSFDESEIPNIIKTCPTVMTDLFELNNYINTDLCRMMFNTYYRGTSVISPTPMIDPYHESLTRKMDVQSMRFFKELSAMPYETDITLVYPEMDKEFNSHDSKGEVSDDGTYAFFAFLSHLCDRCGGFWGDAQDRDQIIKRIRGIAGKNYHLKRRKVKMPFMLNLIYKPTLKIYNMLLKLITMYLGYRPKTEKKWTCRRKATVYKRNNLSFLYQCLKYVALLFNKIVGYMEHYQYFKIWADVSTKDDFSNAHEITYCINVMDLDHNGDSIYDSTYFKKFYGQLRDILSNKKGIKQNILMLERWKSMDPEFMEYSETAQRLLSKIVNAQFPKDEENK